MAALGNQNAMATQYTQKERKPCQEPKSPRVHRYSPPAPGYFTVSAPTAIARGAMKSTAASSHSVTDPGPACAAAGIQRVPTMQEIVNRVTSRRPSSRLSAGAGSGMPGFHPQLVSNAAQALGEKLRLAAQPHANEDLQPQVKPRHNQHAPVHANAFAKLVAGRGRSVAHQAQGAGPRLAKRQER